MSAIICYGSGSVKEYQRLFEEKGISLPIYLETDNPELLPDEVFNEKYHIITKLRYPLGPSYLSGSSGDSDIEEEDIVSAIRRKKHENEVHGEDSDMGKANMGDLKNIQKAFFLEKE